MIDADHCDYRNPFSHANSASGLNDRNLEVKRIPAERKIKKKCACAGNLPSDFRLPYRPTFFRPLLPHSQLAMNQTI